jgi:hypothetical protein
VIAAHVDNMTVGSDPHIKAAAPRADAAERFVDGYGAVSGMYCCHSGLGNALERSRYNKTFVWQIPHTLSALTFYYPPPLKIARAAATAAAQRYPGVFARMPALQLSVSPS